MKTLYERLEKNGIDTHLLRLKIVDIILKTLLAIQPELVHNYRKELPADKTFQMCFEILGFDILIDEDANPWLLEINQAPSFHTHSDLDFQVKKRVLLDTFKILGLSEDNRRL